MDRLTSEHCRRNQFSRNCWELYAPHRGQVTQLLLQNCAGPRDRLCVLGAGNCNDLELAQLVAAYGEIHRVDLDGQAIDDGVASQQVEQSAKVFRHGGIDVTGISHRLARWSSENPPSQQDIDDCLQQVSRPAVHLPAPFDVVASVCLLTQLIDSVNLTLGERHGRFLDVVVALRQQHLLQIVQSLAAGGRALLITDVVSSQTYPQLEQTSSADLIPLIVELVRRRNFFTGVNPFVLLSILKTDPVIAPLLSRVELLPPWLWHFPTRVYAVCAFQMHGRRLGHDATSDG
jgi:hypothetical protein